MARQLRTKRIFLIVLSVFAAILVGVCAWAVFIQDVYRPQKVSKNLRQNSAPVLLFDMQHNFKNLDGLWVCLDAVEQATTSPITFILYRIDKKTGEENLAFAVQPLDKGESTSFHLPDTERYRYKLYANGDGETSGRIDTRVSLTFFDSLDVQKSN